MDYSLAIVSEWLELDGRRFAAAFCEASANEAAAGKGLENCKSADVRPTIRELILDIAQQKSQHFAFAALVLLSYANCVHIT